MSIIEKALDKLDGTEDDEARKKKAEAEDAAAGAAAAPAEEEIENFGPDEAVLEALEADASPAPPAAAPPPDPPTAAGPVASEPPGRAAAPPPAPAAEPDADSTRHSARLDLERLAAMGIITPTTSNSLIAEQHRMIKRPLLLKATPGSGYEVDKGNLIIVTSSLPSEGKTFISINLAMSIAMEVDRTVLLVDADVSKSDVSKILGLERVEGLTDYLTENVPLSELLVKTNIPKLSVLPAGRRYPNLTELLSSDQMRRLTDELSERYSDRIIVFDSPPLLATSGAAVLPGLMGQVVMVVEAVRTPQSAVQESLRLMGPHPSVGLVLNKSRIRPTSKYQYGYYYGYGYGGS